jgi:hypothetical protein
MTPIVAKVLNIMDKKGLIELPLKVNGLEVKIVPISPLAKAQNLEEINEIMQFVQIAGSLGPGGIAEMKPDLIATYIGDKLGIPSNLRTTPEEKQQIMQQSMQMAQMQQQQMQGGMPPEGGPPMEGPPQEGPPMEEPSGALEQEVSA